MNKKVKIELPWNGKKYSRDIVWKYDVYMGAIKNVTGVIYKGGEKTATIEKGEYPSCYLPIIISDKKGEKHWPENSEGTDWYSVLDVISDSYIELYEEVMRLWCKRNKKYILENNLAVVYKDYL